MKLCRTLIKISEQTNSSKFNISDELTSSELQLFEFSHAYIFVSIQSSEQFSIISFLWFFGDFSTRNEINLSKRSILNC